MRKSAHKLLAIGPESSLLLKVVPLLKRADLQVELVETRRDVLRTVEERHFDLIVVQYSGNATDLAGLVASVRSSSSACLTSGLLVVAEPEHTVEVSRFLGRGVNRILDSTSHVDRLLDGIADLLTVAPRRFLRSVVQLDVWVGYGMKRLLSVTENVSVSGMLVRGGREFELGKRLFFELLLPAQERSIRGDLTVVRHTDRLREGVDGFGGRVLGYVGDGEERLRGFLARPDVDELADTIPAVAAMPD